MEQSRDSINSDHSTSSNAIRNRHSESGSSNPDEDPFNETTAPQSEIVLFIARGVGFVVLITALIIVILFLMFARAILAFLISKFGISGITAILCIIVWIAMKYGNVSWSVLYNTFTRSCN